MTRTVNKKSHYKSKRNTRKTKNKRNIKKTKNKRNKSKHNFRKTKKRRQGGENLELDF